MTLFIICLSLWLFFIAMFVMRRRPYLRLWLDLGFIHLETNCMRYSYEDMTYEYVCLRVGFLNKGFNFRLYRPNP